MREAFMKDSSEAKTVSELKVALEKIPAKFSVKFSLEF